MLTLFLRTLVLLALFLLALFLLALVLQALLPAAVGLLAISLAFPLLALALARLLILCEDIARLQPLGRLLSRARANARCRNNRVPLARSLPPGARPFWIFGVEIARHPASLTLAIGGVGRSSTGLGGVRLCGIIGKRRRESWRCHAGNR